MHQGEQNNLGENRKNETGSSTCDTSAISDFDLNISIQRVHNVLRKNVENNELVARLPLLIKKNGKVLNVLSVEKKEHVDFLRDVCLKFYNNKKIDIPKRKSAPDRYVRNKNRKENVATEKEASAVISLQKTQGVKVCPLLSEAISLFLKFKCINLKKSDIIKKYGIHSNAIKFISCIQILADFMDELLFQSTEEVKEKGDEMAKAVRNSKMLQVVIDELMVKLDKLRKNSSRQLAEKELLLEQLQKKKDFILVQYKRDLIDISAQSTTEMHEVQIESAERFEELNSKVKAFTEMFTTLCNKNLSIEKKLKNKCSKVETQLANWLAKYDSDVGERRMEYEGLQDQLDEIDSAIDDLEDMISDLDVQYSRFKEEEDEEIQEKFNEMAYKFLINRSAMTIQRYWRAYRLEKKTKKKGKGGKKGKGKK